MHLVCPREYIHCMQVIYQVGRSQTAFASFTPAVQIYSGQVPFADAISPQVILGVCKLHQRPLMPENVPKEMRRLAQDCWWHFPSRRPSMEDVLRSFGVAVTTREVNDVARGLDVPALREVAQLALDICGKAQLAKGNLLSCTTLADQVRLVVATVVDEMKRTDVAPLRRAYNVEHLSKYVLSLVEHDTVA